MNAAAAALLKEIPEVSFAYGISDEFRYRRTSSRVDGRDFIFKIVSFSIVPATCSIGETGTPPHPSF